jgi:hypothetical protein
MPERLQRLVKLQRPRKPRRRRPLRKSRSYKEAKEKTQPKMERPSRRRIRKAKLLMIKLSSQRRSSEMPSKHGHQTQVLGDVHLAAHQRPVGTTTFPEALEAAVEVPEVVAVAGDLIMMKEEVAGRIRMADDHHLPQHHQLLLLNPKLLFSRKTAGAQSQSLRRITAEAMLARALLLLECSKHSLRLPI